MIKEGIIPIVAGTVATTAGAILKGMNSNEGKKSKDDLMTMAAAGIIGFGLAHMVLGSIDVAQKRHRNHHIWS